jgi:hypothetical protein
VTVALTGVTAAASAAPNPNAPGQVKKSQTETDDTKGNNGKGNGNNGKSNDETKGNNGKGNGNNGNGPKPKDPKPTEPTPTDPGPTQPSPVTFTVVAEHPQAAQQPTVRGKTLHDLAVDADGKLVAGYGDYDQNTGPIAINPFDPVTGTFDGVQVTIATEELNTFRNLGGALYSPMIDPTTDWSQPAGYATNATGTWTNEAKIPAVHIYDMAERVPGELWMVGSANNANGEFGGATAFRSTDGGKTWQVARQETDTNPANRNGFERYYWVAAMNGKVYMRARDVDTAQTMVFDGTKWSSVKADPCTNWLLDANAMAVFKGKMYCVSPYLTTFDGSKVTTADFNHVMTGAQDFFVADDGYLYGLSSKGIARTSDGSKWETLATNVPAGASSIAVVDGKIYLGTRDAQILAADRTVSQMTGR